LLEVWRFSTVQTIKFAVGIVAIAFSWTRLVARSSGGQEPGEGPLPKEPG